MSIDVALKTMAADLRRCRKNPKLHVTGNIVAALKRAREGGVPLDLLLFTGEMLCVSAASDDDLPRLLEEWWRER